MKQLSIVVVGHVGHGKSTLIDRLLCREGDNTIDVPQTFLSHEGREYVFIDASDNVEFIKNRITGESQADAAILVVDVMEGIQEQTRRHAYLLSFLNIPSIIVAINKMDICEDVDRYDIVENEVGDLLFEKLEKPALSYIPISALNGFNVIERKDQWAGLSILQEIECLPVPRSLAELPTRVSIQGLYRTKIDNERDSCYLARVESGILCGNEYLHFTSGDAMCRGKVRNLDPPNAEAGANCAFQLDIHGPAYDVKRGDVGFSPGATPWRSEKTIGSLFWLNDQPWEEEQVFTCKIAYQERDCTLTVLRCMDTNTLQPLSTDEIGCNDAATVILNFTERMVTEPFNYIPSLGRFALLSQGEIVACGTIK